MRSNAIAIGSGLAVAVFLLVSAYVGGEHSANAATLDTSQGTSAQQTRACSFAPGGWTIVDCSNVAAATSSQLTQRTRYAIQCGVNSRIAWGGSGVTADASDGYLPAGGWVEHYTATDSRYYSCLNIGSDDDCRHIECR